MGPLMFCLVQSDPQYFSIADKKNWTNNFTTKDLYLVQVLINMIFLKIKIFTTQTLNTAKEEGKKYTIKATDIGATAVLFMIAPPYMAYQCI